MSTIDGTVVKSSPANVDTDADVVKHQRWRDAMDELLFQLRDGKGFELIVLVGPTGAGKTKMLSKLVAEIHRLERAEMTRDPDYVPVVVTCAEASGHRGFDWKGLYTDAAKAAGDPFADVRRARLVADHQQRGIKRVPVTTSEFRRSMVAEFSYRRTRYWIIDEAYHILSGAKSGGNGDQFDVLKSVAQKGAFKIVLVGPYALTSIIDCSGQLARRGATVHLARYSLENAVDKRNFASAVSTILKMYRLEGYPGVNANLKFYYTGCAGCIGILKDWCDRAVAHSKSRDTLRILTLADLQAKRLRKDALETIWRELLEGEAFMNQGSDEEVAALETLVTADRLAQARMADKLAKETKARGKPGIPNPRRDPVAPSARTGSGAT